MKEVMLSVNCYLQGNYRPHKRIQFIISEDCLKEYLFEVEDRRDVQNFLSTYTSEESRVIYRYASDDNRILSAREIYPGGFIEEHGFAYA